MSDLGQFLKGCLLVVQGKEQEKKERQLRQVLGSRMLFTKAIYKHMKEMGSPITKLPSLGFKKGTVSNNM